MAYQPPLALLRAHAQQKLAPEEAGMVAAGIEFIEAHPDCLLRSCLTGHLTGSAWVVNRDRSRVLLLLHRKLQRWLNPGGHADGDPDLAAVALREAREESGLKSVRLGGSTLLDFDQHWIPDRQDVPGHYHYDFRFLCQADDHELLVISDESTELTWVPRGEVTSYNSSSSIRRLLAKTPLSRA